MEETNQHMNKEVSPQEVEFGWWLVVPRADVADASGLPSSLPRIDCTAAVASHGQ